MRLKWLIFGIWFLRGWAVGQTSDGIQFQSVTQVYDRNVRAIERAVTHVAELMPADKFAFVPTTGEFKGVRSFGQMVKHVAVDNYMNGAAILGEKVPVEIGFHENGPDGIASKPQIMKFLKDSFDYLDRAVNTVNPENLMKSVKDPWEGGNLPRLLFVNSAISHPWDLYGQMVEYLRTNGIDPQKSN
jgi:hypothetical protein